MNQFEKMKQLFDELGIKYKTSDKIESISIHKRIVNRERVYDEAQVYYTIELEEGSGYAGFTVSFYFGKEGKFLDHSCYE